MRGQIAVELFLVASLTALVLFWMGNYANELSKGSVTSAVLQQRALATSLAGLINQAGAYQVNITHNVTCLRAGTELGVFNLTATSNVVTVTGLTVNATAQAPVQYPASGSLTVACQDPANNVATTLCIFPLGNGVQLTAGGCAN